MLFYFPPFLLSFPSPVAETHQKRKDRIRPLALSPFSTFSPSHVAPASSSQILDQNIVALLQVLFLSFLFFPPPRRNFPPEGEGRKRLVVLFSPFSSFFYLFGSKQFSRRGGERGKRLQHFSFSPPLVLPKGVQNRREKFREIKIIPSPPLSPPLLLYFAWQLEREAVMP